MLDVTCNILCEAELVAAHKLTHNNRMLSVEHYLCGRAGFPLLGRATPGSCYFRQSVRAEDEERCLRRPGKWWKIVGRGN